MRGAGLLLRSLYVALLAAYGPQGWWPLPSRSGRRGYDERGYHPGALAPPHDRAGRFEVALGAVLTQHTAWTNAERALRRVSDAGVRLPADAARLRSRSVARLVRSSGSYTVKARTIACLASFFERHGLARAPDRDALLGVRGVGPETADSILLYGFGEPVFVVDAYTRRLLARRGVVEGTEPYGEVQDLFHRAIGRDAAIFNEYHALIVRHAKERCRARPLCNECPVATGCAGRDGESRDGESRDGTGRGRLAHERGSRHTPRR